MKLLGYEKSAKSYSLIKISFTALLTINSLNDLAHSIAVERIFARQYEKFIWSPKNEQKSIIEKSNRGSRLYPALSDSIRALRIV